MTYEEITLKAALETAQIHAQRLKDAIHDLCPIFPISENKVKTLSKEELLLIDLLIHRFSKLQDLMGSKLFSLFLADVGEGDETMTFIDRLNKLEKLRIIENAQDWREM